jgi:hypothetical protein
MPVWLNLKIVEPLRALTWSTTSKKGCSLGGIKLSTSIWGKKNSQHKEPCAPLRCQGRRHDTNEAHFVALPPQRTIVETVRLENCGAGNSQYNSYSTAASWTLLSGPLHFRINLRSLHIRPFARASATRRERKQAPMSGAALEPTVPNTENLACIDRLTAVIVITELLRQKHVHGRISGSPRAKQSTKLSITWRNDSSLLDDAPVA